VLGLGLQLLDQRCEALGCLAGLLTRCRDLAHLLHCPLERDRDLLGGSRPYGSNRDRFAPYLPVVGTGRARRYPPQTVERLRWIVEQIRSGVAVRDIEAQLRSTQETHAAPQANGDARLTESVDRLSQRIRELTESLQRLSRILSELQSRARDG
jgi:hypothetical protein